MKINFSAKVMTCVVWFFYYMVCGTIGVIKGNEFAMSIYVMAIIPLVLTFYFLIKANKK